MDEIKELAKEILKKLAEEFKEDAKEVASQMGDWAKILAKIKYEIAKGGDEDKIKELKKSEDYAWAGILALKAEYAKIIEEKTWNFVEKVLRLIRIVFLV